MKNDSYDRAMKEIWEAKDKIYNDFISSKEENFIHFLKKELDGIKISYRNKKDKAA